MPALLWLLAQAVAADAAPPLDNLQGVVVDAIRNCVRRDGEITVCSRDRGFAEGQRMRKIAKPKPVPSGGGVKVQVTTGPTAPKADW